MTRAEFRGAVHKGLGRAILYARSNDVSEFQDIILDACLHNLAIDPICEGTHGEFALFLIEKLPDRDFYVQEILKALPQEPESWHSAHRFYLAMNFALDGSDTAKRAMYDAYVPGPRFGEQIGNNFTRLDGLNGFLFAAERIGALLLSGCDSLDHGWLLSAAEQELGEETVCEALRATRVDNPRIGAYCALDESPPDRDSMLNDTYDDLKPKIARTWSFHLQGWGEKATATELELAARGLLTATDPAECAGHLGIFCKTKFPFGPEPLLLFADSPDRRVAYRALTALSLFSHPAVRELAVQLIAKNSPYRDEAISLLLRNFKPGDHAVALEWFVAEQDLEIIHGLSGDLRQLWDDYPNPATEVTMLMFVYEHDPCSFNREFVVRRLLELNAVTEAMRNECVWDANDEIRDLFKA